MVRVYARRPWRRGGARQTGSTATPNAPPSSPSPSMNGTDESEGVGEATDGLEGLYAATSSVLIRKRPSCTHGCDVPASCYECRITARREARGATGGLDDVRTRRRGRIA